jgi:hypothetical protein
MVNLWRGKKPQVIRCLQAEVNSALTFVSDYAQEIQP